MRFQAHIQGIKSYVSFYLDHGSLLHTLDIFLLSATAAFDVAALDVVVPSIAALAAAVPGFLLLSAAAVLAVAVLARAIMSTSDEISTAFTAAADIFNLSLGATTDADVECIRRAVVEIL